MSFQNKSFYIKVFDSAGNFITTWSEEVLNDPSFKMVINSGLSELQIKLARKFDSINEDLPTDINFRNEVQVWITDKEAVNGLMIYDGFISDYSPYLDEKDEYIMITCLGYIDDLSSTELIDVSGNTGIAYNNIDPGDIIKDVLSKLAIGNPMAKVFNITQIQNTGTPVVVQGNQTTALDMITKAKNSSPTDWYFFIDANNNIIFKEAQTATPDHVLYVEQHILKIDTCKTMKDLKNEVRFIGGFYDSLHPPTTPTPPYLPDTQLYIVIPSIAIPNVPATASQAKYGKRIHTIKDTSVIDPYTASLQATKYLEENLNPAVRATIEVLDSNGNNDGLGYDIESLKPGQSVQIIDPRYPALSQGSQPYSFSNAFIIQTVQYDFDKATIELAVRPPWIVLNLQQQFNNLYREQSYNIPITPSIITPTPSIAISSITPATQINNLVFGGANQPGFLNVINGNISITDPSNNPIIVNGILSVKTINSNSLVGSGDISIATLIGYTPENVANKSTNVALGTSDTLYPTQNAVKTYADGLVVGLLDYRGAYNASSNTYPTTGGSGTAGAVLKGDTWVISVAGILGGVPIQIGDTIIANIDTPGQTAANWNTLNTNISYVPEDAANKVTSVSGSSTDVQYPSAKLLYTSLGGKQDTLISATNIKTINGASILGGGDLAVSSMVYPGAGIAVSTSSAWTTSLTAPSGAIVGTTDAQTLTNKRSQPRIYNTTTLSTLTPEISTYDEFELTAQAGALTIANHSTSTPVGGEKMIFRIFSAASQTITWGNKYRSVINNPLPTATLISQYLYIGVEWNATDSMWDMIAINTGNPVLNNYPEGTMINGRILPSVDGSGKLTVALKTLAGNDPSSTDPVYIMIGGVVRSITSALSITISTGTNRGNAGSAELATKEIDWFVYLNWYVTGSVVQLQVSRIPNGKVSTDFTYTGTGEKDAYGGNVGAGDVFVNIGRFAVTLSAGAGYTWSVPTFTADNLIQKPIYTTRDNSISPVISSHGGAITAATISITANYQIINNRCIYTGVITLTNIGSGSPTGITFLTLPFAPKVALREVGSSMEVSATGYYGSSIIDAGNLLDLSKYDYSTWFVNGYKVCFSIDYEI